ncbi:hypothetical protein ACFZCK_24040 [Kitasatospora purpeofusca]|uniref:hypothetical protein n=1 Tax=Kitasatospora purpeofusca TaxID=67352 RepID=UPI0036E589E7
MSLYDLRYSHAELARAAREGRRPAPARRLHRTTTWQWIMLHCRGDSFTVQTATAEGRARLRGRLAAQRICGLHRAGHEVEGEDMPPVRHRRGVLWNA